MYTAVAGRSAYCPSSFPASWCSTLTSFSRSMTAASLSGYLRHRLTLASLPSRVYVFDTENPPWFPPNTPLMDIIARTRNFLARSKPLSVGSGDRDRACSTRAYGVSSICRTSSSLSFRSCSKTFTISSSRSFTISIGAGFFAMVSASDPPNSSIQQWCSGQIPQHMARQALLRAVVAKRCRHPSCPGAGPRSSAPCSFDNVPLHCPVSFCDHPSVVGLHFLDGSWIITIPSVSACPFLMGTR